MRAKEFITLEQHLNELVPIVNRNNSLAKAQVGMKQMQRTQGSTSTIKPTGTKPSPQAAAKQIADPAQLNKAEKAIDQAIRPGQKVPLPTAKGAQEFKIKARRGDEVELENPDGNKDPNQPNSLTYKVDDVKKSIAI